MPYLPSTLSHHILPPLISPLVNQFIRRHRDSLAPRAQPISPAAQSELATHFTTEDLHRARVLVSDPLPIAEPPFTSLARKIGFDFPGLSFTAAITFDHVIATRQPMSPALLFHEMVHVVQYRILGISAFASRYVHGFLSTGSYHQIPLERCAYELEARFSLGHNFQVEAEVAKWLNR